MYPSDMNGPESIAYMRRYPDVKKGYAHYRGYEFVKKVVEQWNTVGKKENRKPGESMKITKLQAECYLNRYPDLKKAFGTSSNSWIKAQHHYYKHGFKEKRNY